MASVSKGVFLLDNSRGTKDNWESYIHKGCIWLLDECDPFRR